MHPKLLHFMTIKTVIMNDLRPQKGACTSSAGKYEADQADGHAPATLGGVQRCEYFVRDTIRVTISDTIRDTIRDAI